MSRQAAYQTQMFDLQQGYLTRLRTQLREIKRFRELLTTDALPERDLMHLYKLTHNFVGSGTTFGYPGISRAALALHGALKALLDASPGTAQMEHAQVVVLASMEHFEQACHQAIASHAEPSTIPSLELVTPQPEEESKTLGLICRDQARIQRLAEAFGAEDYTLIVARNLEKLNEAISIPTLHAVLVAEELDDDEQANLDYLRQADHADSVPLIRLSERGDFSARLSAVRAGASGYFTPSATPASILSRIDTINAARRPATHRHILVVDDDQMIGEAYVTMLQHAGYSARLLLDPEHILDELSDHPADLILTDLMMPECKGHELAALLRQHELFGKIPLILMSVHEDIAKFTMSQALDVDDYLIKPFTPETLFAAVSRHTRKLAPAPTK